jgi:sterol desaturase/sphingolipid hydroxylase (fatty acid hydroxylase superfamily)
MGDVFHTLLDRVSGLGELLMADQSRTFWGYLVATAAIAFFVWLAETKDRKGERSLLAFQRYLLPKRIYGHHSFRLDAKLAIFGVLTRPAGWFVEGLTLLAVADYVSDGYASLLGAASPSAPPSTMAKVGLGTLLFVASDLARFLNHYLHHRIPALWELHKVHHSAEHLNPLTTYRFHPLEMIVENFSVVLFVGIVAGITQGLMGGSPLIYYGTVNTWIYLRFANALGVNIRHMHVWWAWNPKLSHVLSSPAQHQIHHSTDPKHYDKNFGFFLSVWDWMFGTLYVPKEKETLEFGLTDGTSHKTLTGALFGPLGRIAGLAGRRLSPRPQTGTRT